MAPAATPTFALYGLRASCTGCGRKLRATEMLWFQAHPFPAVYGFSCCAINNRK
jgi:hypothetical protein